MLHRNSFTEADKATITKRFTELAAFEKGDRVTVDKLDNGIRAAGDEYAGFPMEVRSVFWNQNNLTAVRENGRNAPQHRENRSEAEYVTLEDDYEYYAHDRVLLSSIEYDLEPLLGREKIHPVSESALIPWEEYREENDEVHLKPERDGKYNYVRPAGDDEEPCPICGSEQRNISGHDQKVVHVGAENCAACGHLFQRWD